MNFLKIFSDRFQDAWERPALTDYETGLTLTYSTLAARMLRIHLLFENIGVEKGSRVAVVGHNSIDWITIYMAGLTYGVTMITLPTTIPVDEIMSLLGDVKTEFLFIDSEVFPGTECLREMPAIRLIISTDTHRVLARRQYGIADPDRILEDLDNQFLSRYPYGFHPEHAVSPVMAPDDIVAIFFTAGTTGRPRGVQLMADNLEANIIHGIKSSVIPRSTTALLATNLGNVWTTVSNLLIPLASGAHLTVFKNVGDRVSFLRVLRKVRPNRLMLTPRKVGWIYDAARNRLKSKKLTRWLLHHHTPLPLKHLAIHNAFNKVVGGRCQEIAIFAYPLGPSLARKLQSAGIRYNQTYGLAECGGLISYSPGSEYTPGTSGRVLRNTVKCRLRPIDIPGLPDDAGFLEISGMTVMKGYDNDRYNEDAFTRDRWFKTGDIATISSNGDIKVLGRINTLIKHNGYAISPEKLGLLLIDNPFVLHATIVMRDDKLTAIIQPDIENITHYLGAHSDVNAVIHNVVSDINRVTALYERIQKVEVCKEPVHTTIKHTVARYRYL